jgi:hypothetical protein
LETTCSTAPVVSLNPSFPEIRAPTHGSSRPQIHLYHPPECDANEQSVYLDQPIMLTKNAYTHHHFGLQNNPIKINND